MKKAWKIFLFVILAFFVNWFVAGLSASAVQARRSLAEIVIVILLMLATLLIKLQDFLLPIAFVAIVLLVVSRRPKEKPLKMRAKIFAGMIIVCLLSLWFFLVPKIFKPYAPKVRKLFYSQSADIMNFVYSKTGLWTESSWLGIKSEQYPTDNWITQELITEIKPDFIVETGTNYGGTALFYANVLEKVNTGGKVITVDIENNISGASQFKSFQERVEFIQGDSASAAVVDEIAKRVGNGRVLVTLDSLHTKGHVSKELSLYSPLVSLGSYIIVQDTHISRRSDSLSFSREGGPLEAMEEFLRNHKNFKVDKSREKYLITQHHPCGFLKRIQ